MRPEIAKRIMAEVRQGYDTIAADFAATRHRPWPEMAELAALVPEGSHVIDIGCGNGRAYQLFLGRAIDYLGFDNSERLVALAKAAWRDPLADFRVGDVLSVPVEDGEADVVLSFAVLHHVPLTQLRRAAFTEMARILRPGGLLLMTNWNLWQRKYIWFVIKNAVRRMFRLSKLDFGDALIPWKRGLTQPLLRYCHAFTRGEIARLCQGADLTVDKNYLMNGNIVTVARKPKTTE